MSRSKSIKQKPIVSESHLPKTYRKKKEESYKSFSSAYSDKKKTKQKMRKAWIKRISAALHKNGTGQYCCRDIGTASVTSELLRMRYEVADAQQHGNVTTPTRPYQYPLQRLLDNLRSNQWKGLDAVQLVSLHSRPVKQQFPSHEPVQVGSPIAEAASQRTSRSNTRYTPSYSQFQSIVKTQGLKLDRKMLAHLLLHNQQVMFHNLLTLARVYRENKNALWAEGRLTCRRYEVAQPSSHASIATRGASKLWFNKAASTIYSYYCLSDGKQLAMLYHYNLTCFAPAWQEDRGVHRLTHFDLTYHPVDKSWQVWTVRTKPANQSLDIKMVYGIKAQHTFA